MRGHGDAMALRLAFHDAKPSTAAGAARRNARAVFDAAEQARDRGASARMRMEGVAAQSAAMLDERYRPRAASPRSRERAEAPLEDALALMVREQLTGEPPPDRGKAWSICGGPGSRRRRATISRRLAAHVEDQAASARSCAMSCRSRYGRRAGGDGEREEDEERRAGPDEGGEQPRSGRNQDGRFGGEDRDGESDEATIRRAPRWKPRTPTPSASTMTATSCARRGEVRRGSSPNCRSRQARRSDYKLFTDALRRDHQGRRPVRCRRTDAAARLPRPAACTAAGRGGAARQPAAAPADGAAEPLLGFRSGRRPARCGAAAARRHRSDAAAVLQGGARHRFPRHGGDAAARQFRFDARPADHGRGDCADILARTLERCGVKVEILGFTTRAWKGGQSREAWLAAGKPPNPGRLNDLRHIIYKSADAPWRRRATNLGLMMREGLLKENIDGEALVWAHARLLARPEQRRILMVISDGAPVDDSTLSVNPAIYLERHLRQVIEEIETRSPVELIAIGIGHDVTRYYRRAVTIIDAEQLGGAMTEKLAELFEEAPAPGRAPGFAPRRMIRRALGAPDAGARRRRGGAAGLRRDRCHRIADRPLRLSTTGATEIRRDRVSRRPGAALGPIPHFGSLSGFDIAPDGRLFAVADTGFWVTGRLVEDGEWLAGVRALRWRRSSASKGAGQ